MNCELRLAVADGREVADIEIMDACRMYISNSWYKTKIREFGSPKPGQLIVVVFYSDAVEGPVAPRVRSSVNKIIAFKPAGIPGQDVSSGAAHAKAILVALAVKNNTQIVQGGSKQIHFEPYYFLRLAA